jgi:pyrimidine deaminase RibD-like protein
LPECLPNLPVGCVIVDSQEIVAQGYTQVPGKHYVEADALKPSKRKSFRFNKILVAIAGITVLPSTILGANVTIVTTFIAKNVSKSSQDNDTAFNADVCVQYDTSTIVTNT